jgi:bifunctional DNase/RNase
MEKIPLDIVALSHSVTQSHNYAVVLGEKEGNRRLPVVIGGFEAQAIAVAMENMTPNRPLTHDLFRNTLDVFGVKIVEVVINNLVDGIFYAQLVCEKDGEHYEVDSRTSDAIAMAVRFECPIYTFETIMESAGIILEDEGDDSAIKKVETKSADAYENLSVKALTKLLDEVLENEDYERAAKIRDEINRRTSAD